MHPSETRDIPRTEHRPETHPGNPAAAGYDLVLLLGQSNVSGRGVPIDTVRHDVSRPRVQQYGSTGPYAGVISPAVEPLAMHDTPTGIGPGLVFARWYADSVPVNRRVLLVPAAHGGTSLVTTDVLGWRRGVPGNLYAQAVAQTRAARDAAGPGARIVAAVWLQGESDGSDGVDPATYQNDFDALIAGLRTDLGVPDLPFIVGQMVPEYLDIGTRTGINAVHAATPTRLPRTAFARSPFGQDLGDGNHFNASGQRIIGRRMFDAYRRIVTAAADPDVPAAPTAVTDLTTSATTHAGATLEWTPGAGAEAHLVECRPSSASSWSRAVVPSGTVHTVTGLSASTAYDCRVTSLNVSGSGPPSATVTVTTGAAPLDPWCPSTAPTGSAPTV